MNAFRRLRIAILELSRNVNGLVAKLRDRQIVSEGEMTGPAAREYAAARGFRLPSTREVVVLDLDQMKFVDKNVDERATAAKALARLGDPRAIEALEVAANSDPAEEVKKAARDALDRFSGELERRRAEREMNLRAAADRHSSDQAARDDAAARELVLAQEALRNGLPDTALDAYKRACHSGGIRTVEDLVRRSAEIERELGALPAAELLVECYASISQYCRERGFQARAQSADAKLKSARAKLSAARADSGPRGPIGSGLDEHIL